ncbi:MAG TPA: hypothetical protein VIF10_15515 [Methylobacter sp.]|jgi:hypothetical protein
MPFIAMLDEAINDHSFSPKEVRIGLMLWKVLEEDGRIKWKQGVIQPKPGLICESEFEFPFLNGDIFVHIDPRLDLFEYQLPTVNSCQKWGGIQQVVNEAKSTTV